MVCFYIFRLYIIYFIKYIFYLKKIIWTILYMKITISYTDKPCFGLVQAGGVDHVTAGGGGGGRRHQSEVPLVDAVQVHGGVDVGGAETGSGVHQVFRWATSAAKSLTLKLLSINYIY